MSASTTVEATEKSSAKENATQNNNDTPKTNNNNKPPPKPIEYNPRFRGYTLIALTSIINLSSVSNISSSRGFIGEPAVAAAFSALTMAFAVVVVALDRTQFLAETFSFNKAMEGYLEGYVLAVFTLLWVCLVGFITQVDGIAYLTMNIYVSTWLTLASVVYTLNEWSASKDILSIGEMTGVSATLKSWYILLFSSLVVLGTSANVLALYAGDESTQQGDAALCLAVGIASSILSLGWICVHYKFIRFCSEGGWTELLFCGAAILVWVVATAVATKEGGVGSTIVGNQCYMTVDTEDIQNCTVLAFDTASNETIRMSCQALARSLTSEVRVVPGSNLYVFSWLALTSSIHIAFRWKAQQAIQFAQAQHKEAAVVSLERKTDTNRRDLDDDDNGLDEFDDADDEY